jgi:transposase
MKVGGKLRVFTVEFKTQVVQRMQAGEPISGLSREVKVKRSILYRWRAAYRKDGVEGLARPRGRPPGPSQQKRLTPPPPAGEERIRALERKVGQQALVIDFLQRACKRVKELRPTSKEPGVTASMERSKP